MFRFYYLLLLGLAVTWFVLSTPNVGLVLVYLTLGLALPLFFAPTLFIYLACLAPMLHLWGFRATRATGVLASAAALAVVALTPGLMSERRAAAKLTELQAASLWPEAPVKRRSLQFDLARVDLTACDTLCRYLMRTGQLDWVRAAADPDQTIFLRRGASPATVVRAGFGADCVIDDPLAISARFCPLVVADSGAAADLVYTEERYTIGNDDKYLARRGLEARDGQRLAFAAPDSGALRPVLVNLTETAEPYMVPIILQPDLRGDGSSGEFEAKRRERRLNAMDFETALVALGYRLPQGGLFDQPDDLAVPPVVGPPTAAQTRTAISVLDLPIDEPFNRLQEAFLAEWADRARNYGEWNEFRVALAGRILRDQRVSKVDSMAALLQVRPIADRYLDDVLALIEAEGVASLRGGARSALAGIGDIDIDILTRHKETLIRLSQRYDLSIAREPVRTALWRIGRHEAGLVAAES